MPRWYTISANRAAIASPIASEGSEPSTAQGRSPPRSSIGHSSMAAGQARAQGIPPSRTARPGSVRGNPPSDSSISKDQYGANSGTIPSISAPRRVPW